MQGRILKAVGGFYYVETENGVCECKARGIFRKEGDSPLTGDLVKIKFAQEGYPVIEQIMPRKNSLIRPPIANIDILLIVCSTIDPVPNSLVLDKITVAASHKNIEPLLVFSKTDLHIEQEFVQMYHNTGIKTVVYSSIEKTGADKIIAATENKITAIAGGSGVGKSTLLNTCFPDLQLKTGDISIKLKRGKHTTRYVELIKRNNGYIADTPGFSKIDLGKYRIQPENLQACFIEFLPYIGKCKFASCHHLCEKDCAVIDAVNKGTIARQRYNSYAAIYNEIKNIKTYR